MIEQFTQRRIVWNASHRLQGNTAIVDLIPPLTVHAPEPSGTLPDRLLVCSFPFHLPGCVQRLNVCIQCFLPSIGEALWRAPGDALTAGVLLPHAVPLLNGLLDRIPELIGSQAEGVDIRMGVGKNFLYQIHGRLIHRVHIGVLVHIDNAPVGFDVALQYPGKFLPAVGLENLVPGRSAKRRVFILPCMENLMLCQLGHAGVVVVRLDDDAIAGDHRPAAAVASVGVSGVDQAGYEGHRQSRFIGHPPGHLLHLLVIAFSREHLEILRVRPIRNPQLLCAC